MGGSDRFSVVVRCSDPRLDVFFAEEASREAMGLVSEAVAGRESQSEAYISNVGGLLPFTGGLAALVEDAGLLVSLFSEGPARIVLTAHSSCGGYARGSDKSGPEVREAQTADLRDAARTISGELPGVDVAAFYLHLDDGTVEAVEV